VEKLRSLLAVQRAVWFHVGRRFEYRFSWVLVSSQVPVGLRTRTGVVTARGRTPSLNDVLEEARSMLESGSIRGQLVLQKLDISIVLDQTGES
jgi:hypothetical protein